MGTDYRIEIERLTKSEIYSCFRDKNYLANHEAVAFRQNKTKNGRSKEKISSSTEIFIFREIIKVKTYGFLFFIKFSVLSPFPHSVYPRTPLARQPTISAKSVRPGCVLIKKSIFI